MAACIILASESYCKLVNQQLLIDRASREPPTTSNHVLKVLARNRTGA